MKVYVSTYKKYNEGNLKGYWVNLDEFDNYDDFISHCINLHSDETDPELMFKAWEGIPEKFISESWIDKKLWDWIVLDDYEKFITKLYWDKVDKYASVEDILDNYYGEYDSIREFGEYMLSEIYGDPFKDYPSLSSFFNYVAFANDLLMNDFTAVKEGGKYYIFYNI